MLQDVDLGKMAASTCLTNSCGLQMVLFLQKSVKCHLLLLCDAGGWSW